MSAYVNVHGAALSVSARNSVQALRPRAYAIKSELSVEFDGPKAPCWLIREREYAVATGMSYRHLGSGANEEAAWRAALSALRLEDLG